MKTQITPAVKQNEIKKNRLNEFLLKVTEEAGAWLLAGGFFYSIVWIAGNIF